MWMAHRLDTVSTGLGGEGGIGGGSGRHGGNCHDRHRIAPFRFEDSALGNAFSGVSEMPPAQTPVAY